MWNLKMGTNELIYKTEVESQIQKANVWLPGEEKEEINWKFRFNRYTLLYIR